MANLGYRLFNGTTDLVDVTLGNLAGVTPTAETWLFAGRLLTLTADAELVHSAGYDPLDWYISGTSGGGGKYQFHDGVSDSTDGPVTSATVDAIVAAVNSAAGAFQWSIATNSGAGWSAFTHTTSASTLAHRPYPGSGVLEFCNTGALNARVALFARCSTALTTTERNTLTTNLTAWQSLASITNLWRFDGASVVDSKGTSTQNTLTGTTVTANGFPLDDGVGGSSAIDVPALIVPNPAVTRSYYW